MADIMEMNCDITGLKVLLVEPDLDQATLISKILQTKSAEFLVLDNIHQARRQFSHYHPDIAICSAELPDGDGLDLVKEWKSESPSLPVVLLAKETNLESAMTALRSGVFDYLQKPIKSADIQMVLQRAGEITKLRTKVSRMHGEEKPKSAQPIIGSSKLTKSLIASIKKIAKSRCDSCIILGDSGVGKELTAHLLHELSPRSADPFIEINAASIPEMLLESELFGHERGAYTDAKDRKAGLLEIAGRGTVFLDEIGEMPLGLQAKLLRVLESKRFKRLGGVKDIVLKARIVAATNRNLADLVVKGEFRKDLYYRLNVIPIYMHPLCDRPDDIVDIAEHFLDMLSNQLQVHRPTLPSKTVEFLKKHSWPGNVRELKNSFSRALVMYEPEILLPKHLVLEELLEAESRASQTNPTNTYQQAQKGANSAKIGSFDGIALPNSGVNLEAVEESLIKQALDRAKHNQTKAAGLLGISRHALRYRLEKHGLT